MRTNFHINTPVFNHEGGPSQIVSPLKMLKRLTMACMLWEDTFYVDGKDVAVQIEETCAKLDPHDILVQALECHDKGLLRHVPLWLICQALKKGGKAKVAISAVCSRPDQMTELLSLYWKDGKKPLPAQLKKGLATAFRKFDAYQLQKYNRDNPIKLRDVLFLCHAKPRDEKQAETWKQLISNTLPTPETWETKLSAGEDKNESFTELLNKSKMGKLAIIRNLRNMQQSGVDRYLVLQQLMKNDRPILPFQYIAALKECPEWSDIINLAMIKSLEGKEKLKGKTILLIDVSSSMSSQISSKSKMTCFDVAGSLAILLREICEKPRILTFSDSMHEMSSDAKGLQIVQLINSVPHGGTNLGGALRTINGFPDHYDRLIIVTDEQCQTSIPHMPKIDKKYVISVQPYQKGIQNYGQFLVINGFSEHVVDYIQEIEKE